MRLHEAAPKLIIQERLGDKVKVSSYWLVLELTRAELALGWLHFQYVKNDVNIFFVMSSMFFLSFSRASFCMNGKVVHIYREPSLCYLLSEYSVHHHLEGSGRVHKTKKHDCWLKEPFWSEESCLPFVSWLYA